MRAVRAWKKRNDETMTRHGFIKTIGLVAVAMAYVGHVFLGAQGNAGRPNIVFILADDLGWSELGCYGKDGVKSGPGSELHTRRLGTGYLVQHKSALPVVAVAWGASPRRSTLNEPDLRDNQKPRVAVQSGFSARASWRTRSRNALACGSPGRIPTRASAHASARSHCFCFA